MIRPSLVQVLLGAAFLLILPFVAARPFIYTDTVAYYRLGEQVGQILHIPPEEQAAAAPSPSAAPAAPAAADEASSQQLAYTTAGARSPYWSFFLYLTERIGTAWATVAAQALMAAWTIYVLFRASGAERGYLPAMLGLALVSSLPLTAAFLTPDIMTGVTVAAILGLVLYGSQLRIGERIGLWVLLTFALASHMGNLLLAAGLLAVGGGILLTLRTPAGEIVRRLGLIAVAMVVAATAGAAYGAAVKKLKGETLRSPPMLTARLLADGPGRVYLRRVCAESEAYAMCKFAGQPLDDSNTILWSDDPERGAFHLADYATRVRIIEEERRFVLAVVADDPAAVLQTSLANFGRQLVTAQIFEMTGDPTPFMADPRVSRAREILPGAEACLAVGSCAPRLPREALNAVQEIAAIAAVFAALFLLWRARRADLYATAVFVAAAVVGNAAICGVLSGVFQRYQCRILWLLPLLALLVWAAHRGGRPSLPPERAAA